ncbi:hypothetical protein I3F58_12910 [Streptomyces sp. MUM 203J]|nr:hypothetical protein [Streptomyces sp. MUM 203J]
MFEALSERVAGVLPGVLSVLLLLGVLGFSGADGVSPLSSVLAVGAAAAGLLACAVASVLAAPAVPPAWVRTALRDRARRTAFLPQRDPDARGRRRPRAPGRPSPAAVVA